MKILMMTNTYLPHVGGVARSVASFTQAYRERDHQVLVVAPEYENTPSEESGVVRVPAIQHFNNSEFALALPALAPLNAIVEEFRPDVVHSHHPFLIGNSALRVSHTHGVPLVFTHHTMYEDYTHYVSSDSDTMRRFVITLATNYANLCSLVFAPSESVEAILRSRGVEVPIAVVPTGVDIARFRRGSGVGFRAAMGIPSKAFVLGHVGRLAAEKNLGFLAQATAAFLTREPRAHMLVVGRGPAEQEIRDTFAAAGLSDRLHMASTLGGDLLVSSYKAMDVFAFASKSETQGMVLVEAMGGGAPVVALDANGTRDVIVDGANGRLVREETVDDFVAALAWIAERTPEERRELRAQARKTARQYSMRRTADRALATYAKLRQKSQVERPGEFDLWTRALLRIQAEWSMFKGVAEAAGTALAFGEPEGDADR